MGFQWCTATSVDLAFARELTCRNMLRYYIDHDLLWQDEAFDVAWAGRENRLIIFDDSAVGYVSLSRDARALYIRELHVLEGHRDRGAGSWVVGQLLTQAALERKSALRLTVFKNNPAQELYRRLGLEVVGEDECFLRMQRDIDRRSG